MKNILLLCSLALMPGQYSCYSVQPQVNPVSFVPLRSDIVMPPHQRSVESFYLRESLHKKPITELALILIKNAGSISEGYMLELAQHQAQSLGADGIFVLDKEESLGYWKEDNIEYVTVNNSQFRAIAFVYDENLVHAKKTDIQANTTKTEEPDETPVGDGKFIKIKNTPQINLYSMPRALPENVVMVVSDFEPMEFLEKTDIAVYNEARTLKSYFFKVRYKDTEAYASGFDIRKR